MSLIGYRDEIIVRSILLCITASVLILDRTRFDRRSLVSELRTVAEQLAALLGDDSNGHGGDTAQNG